MALRTCMPSTLLTLCELAGVPCCIAMSPLRARAFPAFPRANQDKTTTDAEEADPPQLLLKRLALTARSDTEHCARTHMMRHRRRVPDMCPECRTTTNIEEGESSAMSSCTTFACAPGPDRLARADLSHPRAFPAYCCSRQLASKRTRLCLGINRHVHSHM